MTGQPFYLFPLPSHSPSPPSTPHFVTCPIPTHGNAERGGGLNSVPTHGLRQPGTPAPAIARDSPQPIAQSLRCRLQQGEPRIRAEGGGWATPQPPNPSSFFFSCLVSEPGRTTSTAGRFRERLSSAAGKKMIRTGGVFFCLPSSSNPRSHVPPRDIGSSGHRH